MNIRNIGVAGEKQVEEEQEKIRSEGCLRKEDEPKIILRTVS